METSETGTGGAQEGLEAKAWLTSVPENLRGHEVFKDLDKPAMAFERLAQLHEKSKGTLTIPGDNATDEERAAFYAKLGRPETPDKYGFTKPDDWPENIPYSPDLEVGFKAVAHKVGLPENQAKELYNWYNRTVKQSIEQQQQAERAALDASINQLKDQWKGDEFRVNSELAVRAFKRFGGEEARGFIEETKINGLDLGNHPVFLKVFAAIGKTISDDSMIGERGGNTGEMSDEEKAKARFPKTYNR